MCCTVWTARRSDVAKLRMPAHPTGDFRRVTAAVELAMERVRPGLNQVLERARVSGEARRSNLDGIQDPDLKRSAARK